MVVYHCHGVSKKKKKKIAVKFTMPHTIYCVKQTSRLGLRVQVVCLVFVLFLYIDAKILTNSNWFRIVPHSILSRVQPPTSHHLEPSAGAHGFIFSAFCLVSFVSRRRILQNLLMTPCVVTTTEWKQIDRQVY